MVTTSKYTSANTPALPTVFAPPAPAMPATTVQKMTGAMIILHQLDEPVAERLHRDARLRPEMAEQHADRGRDQHLAVERLVERQQDAAR